MEEKKKEIEKEESKVIMIREDSEGNISIHTEGFHDLYQVIGWIEIHVNAQSIKQSIIHELNKEK